MTPALTLEPGTGALLLVCDTCAGDGRIESCPSGRSRACRHCDGTGTVQATCACCHDVVTLPAASYVERYGDLGQHSRAQYLCCSGESGSDCVAVHCGVTSAEAERAIAGLLEGGGADEIESEASHAAA